MSDVVLFAIGAVVFAVTVYGAVVAMGLTLNRRFNEQHPRYATPDRDETRGSTEPVTDPVAEPVAATVAPR